MLKEIENALNNFIKYTSEYNVDLYNEFSLQHELGIYLREKFKNTNYKIQFERNVSYFGINKSRLIKREIDLSIFTPDLSKKYAIELKYPMNGQYPETMYSFIKDICFCEQLTESGFDGAVAFTIVNDKLFYEGPMVEGIYSYFRSSEAIKGAIKKPTGSSEENLILNQAYRVKWHEINGTSRYYIIVSKKDESKIIKNQIKSKTVEKRNYHSTENMGIQQIKDFISKRLKQKAEDGLTYVELVSGDIHKELKLKNAMPTVCRAMEKSMEEYPNSKIIRLDTVKKYSSTIKIRYSLK